MKIALAQIKVRAARPDLNYQTMLDFCRRAAEQQADLIVLPELAVSGSFLGQAWASPGLLSEFQKYNQKLIAETDKLNETVVVFGSIGLVMWLKMGGSCPRRPVVFRLRCAASSWILRC